MKLVDWQKAIKKLDRLIVQASAVDGSDSWQPFPIGMSWQYSLHKHTIEETQIGSHDKLVLSAISLGTDQNRRPSGINRQSIAKTLLTNGISNVNISHHDYYSILPSYKFIISPEGNGIDCHRHYEALLAGCIPIMERNPCTEEKYKGCPVLWTVDYSEINTNYLQRVYNDMLYKEYDFSSLFLETYSPAIQETIQSYGNYWTHRLTGKAWYGKGMSGCDLSVLNKKLIWITMINSGYVPYAKNFMKSMEKANVSFKLVVFCLDKQAFDQLQGIEQCICVLVDFLHSDFSSDFKKWAEVEYKQIVFAKLDIILHALKTTYSKGVEAIGYIDTDIFLFSDPTAIMLREMELNADVNIFCQCDEYMQECSNKTSKNSCKNVCSGVIVFRNKPEIYHLFKYDNDDVLREHGDQQMLLTSLQKYNIPFHTIDNNIMPNGSYYPIQFKKIPFNSTTCLIHFNYLQGHEKERIMRMQGLWLI